MITNIGIFESLFLYMILGGFLVAGDFDTDVSTWKQLYEKSKFCKTHRHWYRDHCKHQIKDAEKKGNTFSSLMAAVEIVNIYTSSRPQTYKVVNALMRGSYNEQPSDKSMFNEYIRLLEDSYDLLCTQFTKDCIFYHEVFRGQTIIPPNIGPLTSSYTFQSFISTSTSMKTAQKFSKGEIVFTIKGVEGLSLDKFTAVSGEAEILIKPPLTININISLDRNVDKVKIQTLIKTHNGNSVIPQKYVEGSVPTPESSANKGLRLYGTNILLLAVACMTLVEI